PGVGPESASILRIGQVRSAGAVIADNGTLVDQQIRLVVNSSAVSTCVVAGDGAAMDRSLARIGGVVGESDAAAFTGHRIIATDLGCTVIQYLAVGHGHSGVLADPDSSGGGRHAGGGIHR